MEPKLNNYMLSFVLLEHHLARHGSLPTQLTAQDSKYVYRMASIDIHTQVLIGVYTNGPM